MDNCVIPHGYKATALGIIPQEWEVMLLGNLSNSISSGRNKHRDAHGQYPVFGSTGIIGYSSTYEYEGPVILVARVGANAGTLNFASGQYDVSDNTLIITIKQNVYDYNFAYNQLTHYKLNKLVFGSGQPLITSKQLKNIRIPVPPLAEQRKIAEVLSVWDEAIEKQARLIEKLALRKRGLMQRLLSAKLRLPGFSDPWKELKINKITIIRKGEQVNKDVLFSNAKYPVINGGITPSGYLDIYNTKANTITISEGGNSCGYVNFMTTPFWSGGHCYTIEAKDGINNLCIYQLLKNNEKYIMSLRVGSGLPNIQIKDLGNLKFMIPTYQEQTAIAEVLTASDREIELAKEKLERLRRQKRGLMQQLLTGKKRVKYGN